jgi:hypothetical protein
MKGNKVECKKFSKENHYKIHATIDKQDLNSKENFSQLVLRSVIII